MLGYLPGAQKFRLQPGLEGTPVLHCHGLSDPVVSRSRGIHRSTTYYYMLYMHNMLRTST